MVPVKAGGKCQGVHAEGVLRSMVPAVHNPAVAPPTKLKGCFGYTTGDLRKAEDKYIMHPPYIKIDDFKYDEDFELVPAYPLEFKERHLMTLGGGSAVPHFDYIVKSFHHLWYATSAGIHWMIDVSTRQYYFGECGVNYNDGLRWELNMWNTLMLVVRYIQYWTDGEPFDTSWIDNAEPGNTIDKHIGHMIFNYAFAPLGQKHFIQDWFRESPGSKALDYVPPTVIIQALCKHIRHKLEFWVRTMDKQQVSLAEEQSSIFSKPFMALVDEYDEKTYEPWVLRFAGMLNTYKREASSTDKRYAHLAEVTPSEIHAWHTVLTDATKGRPPFPWFLAMLYNGDDYFDGASNPSFLLMDAKKG